MYITSGVHNLECPSLQKLYANISCDNHNCWESYMSPNCAARNVVALKNWLTDFYKSPSGKESRDEVDNASVECLPDLDYYLDFHEKIIN